MTQKEKQLIIKDLCGRLPYGVMIEITSDGGIMEASCDMRLDAGLLADLLHSEDDFRPYLRSMPSMTEEEKGEYFNSYDWEYFEEGTPFDWLNEHHFDYRGLIEKGLALEAPADMYKTK